MSRPIIHLLRICTLVLCVASISTAQSISFQGYLTNPAGTPTNVTTSMTFKLYKNGVAVWSETQPSVTVVNGIFNVLLGSVVPLDTVAFNRPIDLGIKVGADPEIVPRTPLAASAFALGMRGMHAVWASDASRKGYNVIGGSPVNSVSAGAVGATISGGGATNLEETSSFPNQVGGDYGTVGGGAGNTAELFGTTVGGGNGNTASGTNATVGGGDENTASGTESTVGGGENNTAADYSATVSGGEENQANGGASTISGGFGNVAFGDFAAIGGGQLNSAGGIEASIGGGQGNTASFRGTVGGGFLNDAVGQYSTVPGGSQNRATGTASMAAGYKARANHDGSFVWNDYSTQSGNDSLRSTDNNQFLIRAVGGVGIGTTAPITQLHVRESINSTASAANHVALIDNSSGGTSADVLALRIARTTDPETTNVFVSFLHSGDAAGVIRGNGNGGVELFSSGSDYAELLERLDPPERIEAGDVVAVTAAKISRRGQTAERFMIISDRAIIVGNMQDPDLDHLYERVAFIGQVPVKVVGAVRAGDFLVPSGREDGFAVAIEPAAIRRSDLKRVVGTAWESSSDPGLKKVIAEVGLDRAAAVEAALENELAELRDRLSALETRMTP